MKRSPKKKGVGLRTRKQTPWAKTDTQYHYDPSGHLLAENITGTAKYPREYIWLGDTPVAVIRGLQ